MSKISIVICSLLSLAVACLPAYASPTKRKITLTCNSVSGDAISGSATVTLCDSSACTQQLSCSPVTCDSNTVSTTMVCPTSFKVGWLTADITFSDGDGSSGESQSSSTLGGKAYSTVAGYYQTPESGGDGDTDNDTFTLTVK